jgi:PST family polysaccharide transporter
MTLVKTSLLNSVAVCVRMITLLWLNKVLAIYIGPAGYAAIGNFQNAIQTIITFASGAINTGVVKYTAEYDGDEEELHRLWRNAGTIAVIGSAVTGVIVVLFSRQIAQWFLGDQQYYIVFVWFSVTLVFFVINSLLLAVLNGKKQIARYIVCNVAGSLFSLAVTSFMAMKFGLSGALTALAIHPSFSFIVTLYVCRGLDWFNLRLFFGQLEKRVVVDLSKYAAMALTSAICVPISHILIRTHIANTLGRESAGYWEAMWRVSAASLMLVTTTLSLYYLPRLSEIKETGELRKEIFQGYRFILPIAAAFGLTIYLLRDLIIRMLFTPEFIPMRELFALQMVGDTLKIGSWILGYLMLGKAMVKMFVISEIVFALSFYGLTCLFTSIIGLEGVALAHAVNYALYWIVVEINVRKKLF